jgi:hypothetical protein
VRGADHVSAFDTDPTGYRDAVRLALAPLP